MSRQPTVEGEDPARELLLAPLRKKPWYARYTLRVNLTGVALLLLVTFGFGVGFGSYVGYRKAVRELLSTQGYDYTHETDPNSPAMEPFKAETVVPQLDPSPTVGLSLYMQKLYAQQTATATTPTPEAVSPTAAPLSTPIPASPLPVSTTNTALPNPHVLSGTPGL